MLFKINSKKIKTIKYSRLNALKEETILPIEFRFGDGPVEYLENQSNNLISINRLSACSSDQQSPALRTCLDTNLAKQLLNQCLEHFLKYKWKAVPTAKLLVIASSQLAAQKFHLYLLGKSLDAALAVSEDTKEARSAIQRFREDDKCCILVTCQMAYEGLDVPQISHIAYLTNYRSKPWCEQSYGRAIRVNDREIFTKQKAFVFLPRDPLAVKVVEEIEKDQNKYLKIKERSEARKSRFRPAQPSDFTPLESELMETFAMDFSDLREPTKLDASQTAEVVPIPLPPKQQQLALRKRIDTLSKKIAYRCGQPFDEFNRYLKNKFGKSRAHMTLTELSDLLNYLESNEFKHVTPTGGSR